MCSSLNGGILAAGLGFACRESLELQTFVAGSFWYRRPYYVWLAQTDCFPLVVAKLYLLQRLYSTCMKFGHF